MKKITTLLLFMGILGSSTEIFAQETKIFPNPVHTQTSVTVSHISTITMMVLYTEVGRRLVMAIPNAPTSTVSMDLPKLAEGLYFLKIFSTEGSVTKKIIVTR